MFKQLCTFYKGEKVCPFESGKDHAGKFWLAEQFVCEEFGPKQDKEVESDFYRMVAAYIAKWAPYDYPQLIKEYLARSSASEKMKAFVEFLNL